MRFNFIKSDGSPFYGVGESMEEVVSDMMDKGQMIRRVPSSEEIHAGAESDSTDETVAVAQFATARETVENDTGAPSGSLECVSQVSLRDVSLAVSGVTYLNVIFPEWRPRVTCALGLSPPLVDFFSYIVDNPRFVDIDKWDEYDLCRESDDFGDGWYRVYRTGCSGNSSFLTCLWEQFLNGRLDVADPDNLRLGSPDYGQRFPGLGVRAANRLDFDEALFAQLLDEYQEGDNPHTVPLYKEVAAYLNRRIDALNEDDILGSMVANQKARIVLWRADAQQLPNGQCYLASFRPALREAVRCILRNDPPAVTFYYVYIAASFSGWLVDHNWFLRKTNDGACHLYRTENHGPGPYAVCDLWRLGRVGYGDRSCGSMGFGKPCASCATVDSYSWPEPKHLASCGCLPDKPKVRSAVKRQLDATVSACAHAEPGSVVVVRVTDVGSEAFKLKQQRSRLQEGAKVLLQACPDVSELSRKPQGVESYVAVAGAYVEICVPAGVRVCLGAAWITPDKPMTVMGRRCLILGFSDKYTHDAVFLAKSRGFPGWLRWHHIKARSDPSNSESRFSELTSVSTFVYSGVGAETTVSVNPTRIEDRGFGRCERYAESGVVDRGLYGTAVESFNAGVSVCGFVCPPGVKVGFGPRVGRLQVELQGEGEYEVEYGDDAYYLDDGGPSSDGEGGFSHGDAY